MQSIEKEISASPALRSRKWWFIAVGAAVCLVCWVALGVGLFIGVDKGLRLGLVLAAAVTTEGLFWLTAAVLGVRLFEARRELWRRVRGLRLG